MATSSQTDCCSADCCCAGVAVQHAFNDQWCWREWQCRMVLEWHCRIVEEAWFQRYGKTQRRSAEGQHPGEAAKKRREEARLNEKDAECEEIEISWSSDDDFRGGRAQLRGWSQHHSAGIQRIMKGWSRRHFPGMQTNMKGRSRRHFPGISMMQTVASPESRFRPEQHLHRE